MRSSPAFANLAASVSEAPDYVAIVCHAGSYPLTEYQAAIQRAGWLLRRHQWPGLLLDQQLLFPPAEAERAAATAEWQLLPRQLSCQLRVACLPPANVFARLATARSRFELQGSGFMFQSFGTATEAAAWLAQPAGSPAVGTVGWE